MNVKALFNDNLVSRGLPVLTNYHNTTQQPHFLRLPAELVNHIAEYIWEDEDLDGEPDNPIHLNLRLVCRELTYKTSHAFERIYFTHLTAICTVRSLQRLIDVSGSQYARLAQIFTLGHLRLLSVAKLRKMYAYGVYSKFEYLRNPLTAVALEGGLPSLPEDGEGDFLSRTRHEAERYRAAAHEQQELQKTGADAAMIARALLGFTNLQVLSIDEHLGNSSKAKLWGARALLESTGVRVDPEDEMFWPASSISSTTSLTDKILQAALIADRLNTNFLPNLSELNLCSPRDAHNGMYYGPIALQPAKLITAAVLASTMYAHLRSVSLDVHAFAQSEETSASDQDKIRRTFLRLLPTTVEELKLGFTGKFDAGIDTPPLILSPYIETLASTPDWMGSPRLKRLQLHGAQAPTPEQIASVVDKHTSCLEELVIGHFDLLSEGNYDLPWIYVFRAAARCRSLCAIRFHLMSLSFERTTKEETQECLKCLLCGASIDDEADRCAEPGIECAVPALSWAWEAPEEAM